MVRLERRLLYPVFGTEVFLNTASSYPNSHVTVMEVCPQRKKQSLIAFPKLVLAMFWCHLCCSLQRSNGHGHKVQQNYATCPTIFYKPLFLILNKFIFLKYKLKWISIFIMDFISVGSFLHIYHSKSWLWFFV